MSARRAVAQFKARGLSDVRNLHGGLAAWRQENLPVVTGRKQRRQDSR
jgi:rhodanese-related sulfurtransferase